MAITILIVDDEPNIRDTVQDILEAEGYAVYSEGTAAGAMARLKSTPADLALLDFNLPDANGIDLAVQIKKQCSKTASILMTGEARVDLGQARDAVNAVLTKPVDPAQLLKALRAIVDS